MPERQPPQNEAQNSQTSACPNGTMTRRDFFKGAGITAAVQSAIHRDIPLAVSESTWPALWRRLQLSGSQ